MSNIIKKEDKAYLLSENGILDLKGVPIEGTPFGGKPITACDTRGEKLVLIINKKEVWSYSKSEWSRTLTANTTLNCIKFVSDNSLLVGTADARLARVNESGLEFIESFDSIPERKLWYTPWGGPPDLRSIAVSTTGIIYANIHVGWIARSMDSGKSWEMLKEGLEMDVHHVSTHPNIPSTLFAATAEGFYISHNNGNSFVQRNSGIENCYQRACLVFPDKNIYLVSSSKGPHRDVDAQLYWSDNEGKNWYQANGIPDKLQTNIDTFQLMITGKGTSLAIIDNRSLYQTNDYGMNWIKTGENYPKLFTILFF